MDASPDVLAGKFYGGKYHVNDLLKKALDASDFFPSLSGEGKWLSFTAAPVTDEDHKIIGAVEIIEDVSELHGDCFLCCG